MMFSNFSFGIAFNRMSLALKENCRKQLARSGGKTGDIWFEKSKEILPQNI
jgi:hypothetical protein